MFLTRKQVIIRNVKKIIRGLGMAAVMFAMIFLLMLMTAKHNEMSSWFYNLFGM